MTLSRRLLSYSVLGLLCVALLTVRVVLSSRSLFQAGQAALARGEVEEGVTALRRAARMYAPGNPYSDGALRRLVELGQKAEAAGDRPSALLCFREVRSAVLATRGVYTPHPDLLALANARLAVLMAQEEAKSPDLAREPEAERRAWHARALARDDAPRVGWTLLALLGLLVYLGAAVALIWLGVDEAGRLRRDRALRLFSLLGAGAALMLLGLFLA